MLVAECHHVAGDLRRADGDPACRPKGGWNSPSPPSYSPPCSTGSTRVARMIKGQSKFGRTRQPRGLRQFRRRAGPDPVLLAAARTEQWRLDRGDGVCDFRRPAAGGSNATIDDPNKPPFAANYFTGVPAPAGAILALLPVYLAFLGVSKTAGDAAPRHTLLIAFLMVSRLPVFSGRRCACEVPPEWCWRFSRRPETPGRPAAARGLRPPAPERR